MYIYIIKFIVKYIYKNFKLLKIVKVVIRICIYSFCIVFDFN